MTLQNSCKFNNLNEKSQLIELYNQYKSPNLIYTQGEKSDKSKQEFSKNIPTIFDKIINKQIPAKIIFENENVMAFHDVNPQAPIHFLVIPKNKDGLNFLSDAEEKHQKMLGELLYIASKVAKQLGLEKGYRIVINNGRDALQSVDHVHLHVLGGAKLSWPPGTPGVGGGKESEM